MGKNVGSMIVRAGAVPPVPPSLYGVSFLAKVVALLHFAP